MFEGKNILVTGASRGIGRGAAEFLLANGARVILVARDKEKLQELVNQYPTTAFSFPYDLNDLEHMEEIFLFCKDNELKLDGMFHAAGITENCTVRLVEPATAMNTFRINYFALVQIGRFFSMKKYSSDNASVVIMSSSAYAACDKGMSQYVASKSAVNAYVRVMAKEVMKRRIRVNAIAPGFVDTDMLAESRKELDNLGDRIETNQPLGVIPVEQITYLVDFLLSDRSAYITGAVIPVFGGGVI